MGTRNRNFVQTGYRLENTNLPYYYQADTLSVEKGLLRQNLSNIDLEIGRVLSQNSAVALTGMYEDFTYRPRQGLEELMQVTRISYSSFALKGSFRLNTLNHRFFPTKGSEVKAVATYRFPLNSDQRGTDRTTTSLPVPDNYLKILGGVQTHFSLHKNISLSVNGWLGWTAAPGMLYDRFFLGGAHLSPREGMIGAAGWAGYEKSLTDFVKTGVKLQLDAGNQLYFWAGSDLLMDHDFAEDRLRFQDPMLGYTIGMGFQSALGPVYLSLFGNSDRWTPQWFLNFGFPF